MSSKNLPENNDTNKTNIRIYCKIGLSFLIWILKKLIGDQIYWINKNNFFFSKFFEWEINQSAIRHFHFQTNQFLSKIVCVVIFKHYLAIHFSLKNKGEIYLKNHFNSLQHTFYL